MKYFKNENNQIFAYDDEQIKQGYGKDLTPITEAEKDAINKAKEDEYRATPEYKIQEAKQYLADTDHKFYNGYKPKEGEDLVEIERLRDEAREFLRATKPKDIVDKNEL